MTKENVSIRPLDRFNWESALELELHDYQRDFLPDVLYSIAQSKFENLFPHGIFLGGKMVGFLMYGNFGGICWINRIMVDKNFQKDGIGSHALTQILQQLQRDPSCKEIRTSFSRQNSVAEHFFGQHDFRKVTDSLEDEVVLRYSPAT